MNISSCSILQKIYIYVMVQNTKTMKKEKKNRGLKLAKKLVKGKYVNKYMYRRKKMSLN